jgi:hypothetical protein
VHKPKVAAEEHIQFLVAAGPVVAHDACTRLLHGLEPDAASLWQEAQGLVTPQAGVVQGINLLTLCWSDGRASVLSTTGSMTRPPTT